VRVLGIVGSLRADSHNRRLLRAAADELPPDTELVPFETLKAVEPFDETDEHQTGGGMPGADALIAAIRDADAILFVTPEYNGSIPGVLKTPSTGPRAPRPPPPRWPTSRGCDRGQHQHVRRSLGPSRAPQGPWACRRSCA
jgi:NADPH-dependent FMN reductase